MIYFGELSLTTPCPAPARVVAVAAGRLLNEGPVDTNGHWRLATDENADTIIAQQHRTAVAAAALAAQPQMRIRLPGMVALEFETHDGPDNLPAWLDPVALQGFPDALIGTLFARAGRVVDLHVCEFQLSPGRGRVSVPVQPGRYRLSAGTVAVRPGFGAAPMKLSGVTDCGSNTRLQSRNGLVALDVTQSSRYCLHFAEATSAGESFMLDLD